MNVKQLLDYGKEELNKVDDGHLKAKILLEFILNIKREELILNYERQLNDDEINAFKIEIDKIKQGTPIQYITNKQEFMKMEFYVDENVLIPQPDTEILVEKTLEKCREFNKRINVLDLCTGSGVIAISVAKYADNVNVYASDISKKAVEIAKKNAESNNVNVEFVNTNMFKHTPENFFDIIVSNPPYIETDVIKNLSEEVKHEPMIALDGGEDGLDFYNIIANEYKKYLKDNGYLLLEIGYDQKEKVSKLFNNKTETVKDLSGNDRVIIVKKDG